jgi:hypothetical protein
VYPGEKNDSQKVIQSINKGKYQWVGGYPGGGGQGRNVRTINKCRKVTNTHSGRGNPTFQETNVRGRNQQKKYCSGAYPKTKKCTGRNVWGCSKARAAVPLNIHKYKCTVLVHFVLIR